MSVKILYDSSTGSILYDSTTQKVLAGPSDCLTCDDLPPTSPTGPPVHIHVSRTLSGTCAGTTISGTVEYDLDLGFALQGSGSDTYCGHSIFDNGFGHFWTGHFFCGGGPFYEHGDGTTQGFGGFLGRKAIDCTWWFEMDAFLPTSCGGCSLGEFTQIFEQIAGPGDPTGVYSFTQTTSGGFTLNTVVTIT